MASDEMRDLDKYLTEFIRLGDTLKKARPHVLKFLLGSEETASIDENTLVFLSKNVNNEMLTDKAFRELVSSALETNLELKTERLRQINVREI